MNNLLSFRKTLDGYKGLRMGRIVNESNQVDNYLDSCISYLNLLLAYSLKLEVFLMDWVPTFLPHSLIYICFFTILHKFLEDDSLLGIFCVVARAEMLCNITLCIKFMFGLMLLKSVILHRYDFWLLISA